MNPEVLLSNSRSSSSGSAETEPYCDREGNRSSNGPQERLGTGQKKIDTSKWMTDITVIGSGYKSDSGKNP